MLEVLSAVSGESIAVFEDEEIAEASVKALKQQLARKIDLPRFRLRLLHDDSRTLDDDQTLTLQVVQLVILEFLPPDTEQDRRIILACEENDAALLGEAVEQATKSEFSRCKSNRTPVCGSPQWKPQMCTFNA